MVARRPPVACGLSTDDSSAPAANNDEDAAAQDMSSWTCAAAPQIATMGDLQVADLIEDRTRLNDGPGRAVDGIHVTKQKYDEAANGMRWSCTRDDDHGRHTAAKSCKCPSINGVFCRGLGLATSGGCGVGSTFGF